MALRYQPQERDAQTILDWPRPAKLALMDSHAYRVLRQAVARYVEGEISGRSVLISGNRGSGKTSLVANVVQDVAEKTFDEWVVWREARKGAAAPDPPRARLRRPLLVKLHGPSLVAAARESAQRAKSADSDEKKGADAPKGAGNDEAPKAETSSGEDGPAKQNAGKDAGEEPTQAGKDRANASEKKPDENPPVDPADQLAHTTLKQIAIQLYRAMASEFANCYANHAASRREPDPATASGRTGSRSPRVIDADEGAFAETATGRRLYEIAGQFRLDVDQSIDPVTARDYWEWVDALRTGVLWPRLLTEGIGPPALARDQGMLEIQALVTAAQCFKVCSGDVASREKVTDAASRELSWQAKLGADLAGLLSRLAGLGLGGLAGYGVGGGATGAAIGAGLAAAATGTLSINRTRKQEANLDYSFIRDFSLATLERDLPLVIERARAAGLAPIFVIDELDKLDDAEGSIKGLIDRLKHLTTDYGFFCFLTAPDYFATIRRKIERGAYPREHSFFGERLFVSSSPGEVAKYLERVIVEDPTPDASEGRKQAQALARAMMVRLLMFRSQLNNVDLMREIASAEQREFDGDPFDLVSSLRNRLALTVQLAIESRLERGAHAGGMRKSSWRRQLALDALFRFPREWAEGASRFEESEASLARYLLKRLKSSEQDEGRQEKRNAAKEADQSVEMANTEIGKPLFEFLFSLSRLGEPLGSFEKLFDLWSSSAERPNAAEAIPRELRGGLLETTEDEFVRRVCFDQFGKRLAADGESGDAQGTVTFSVADAVELTSALVTNLGGMRVSVRDARGLALLPPIFAWSAAEAAKRSRDAGRTPNFGDELAGHEGDILSAAAILKLRVLPQFTPTWEDVLTWEVGVAFNVECELLNETAGPFYSSYNPSRTIERIRRYSDFRTNPHFFLPDFADDEICMPHRIRESICREGWVDFKQAAREKAERRGARRPEEVQRSRWRKWETWIKDSLTTYVNIPVEFDDLLLAGAGLTPTSLFQNNIWEMGPLDWSRITLNVANAVAKRWHAGSSDKGSDSGDHLPAWLCLAGLAALGFPKSTLKNLFAEGSPDSAVVGGPFPPWDAETISPNDLISSDRTAEVREGAVVIYRDVDWVAARRQTEGPFLFVAEQDLYGYNDAWNWLRRCKIFSKVRYQGSETLYEA